MNRDEIRRLEGKTIWVLTGCGKLYITLNFYEGKLVEVFLNLGRSGGCASGFLEAIGRLVSIGLQNGLDLNLLVKQLAGVKCPRVVFDKEYRQVESCSDAVARVLSKYANETIKVRATGEEANHRCPECGSENIEWQGRCFTCLDCGYSKC